MTEDQRKRLHVLRELGLAPLDAAAEKEAWKAVRQLMRTASAWQTQGFEALYWALKCAATTLAIATIALILLPIFIEDIGYNWRALALLVSAPISLMTIAAFPGLWLTSPFIRIRKETYKAHEEEHSPSNDIYP